MTVIVNLMKMKPIVVIVVGVATIIVMTVFIIVNVVTTICAQNIALHVMIAMIAFTLWPPLTTPHAPANHNRSGRPGLPVAIMPPRGRSPLRTCSKNGWPARHRVRTASPLPKPSACTPSNSTAPKSAAGPSRTRSLMPSRQKRFWPPCAAGNAIKSANSGNSTPRRTVGFRTPSVPSPCSTCSMIAAACSPAQSFTSANSCSPTSTSCPPLSWPTDARSKSTSITTVSFSRTSPTPSPSWAGRSSSMTSVSCYAPTPQAKGKVEREHQFWQGRLPAYFASEKITEIEIANPHIHDLRAHRNAHEVHRELRQTPQRAWDQAQKEKRSVLRPAPRCPWWDYVWSVRTLIKVGSDGRVPIGTQRLRIEKPPGNQSRALSPPFRPSLRPGGPARSQAKTRAPLHQSSLINIPVLLTTKYSCFENYATQTSILL